jgi:hypothetical protein
MSWPTRQPRRSEIDPAELSDYDMLLARVQRDLGISNPEVDAGYYGRLLASPAMANRVSEFGRMVRGRSDRTDTYTHQQREFVNQVLSVDFGTNIVQKRHVRSALASGVRHEAIVALRGGNEEDLTVEETHLTDFIRRVIAGTMSKETWEAMETRIGERGTVEYAIRILFLQLNWRLMQAVGMPDIPDAEVEQLIKECWADTKRQRPVARS